MTRCALLGPVMALAACAGGADAAQSSFFGDGGNQDAGPGGDGATTTMSMATGGDGQGASSDNNADGMADTSAGATATGNVEGDDGPGSTDAPDTGDGGASCGDGLVEGAEACDGPDLAGEDCVSQGFDEGTLACAGDCMALDTSGCTTWSCGNDLLEGDEACDGTDLSGLSCASQGFDGGVLGCAANCSALDTSGCTVFSCGNGVLEGAEVCDGAALAGASCATQGQQGGTIACTANCAAFDLSGCTCAEQDVGGAVGAAVASGNTAGEDDSMPSSCGGGVDRLVSFTASGAGDYVFDTENSGFDTVLTVFGSCDPLSELSCNDDTTGLQSEVTLTLAAGEQVLLSIEGYMGATGAWVLNINSGGACTEVDIGSMIGAAVATGNTGGEDQDFTQSCGFGGSVDSVVRFVAPATATFVFDTVGSAYDTVLSVHDSCDAGTELSCNDDTSGLQSEVSVALTAGQEVFIVVSGYNGDTGAWTLNAAQL